MTIRTMYDALTARYTFACPKREQAQVSLSSFACSSGSPVPRTRRSTVSVSTAAAATSTRGSSRTTISTRAPLGAHAGAFVDLMTSRTADAADELLEAAASHLRAGEWPWTFYCYAEGRPRPVFPSSFVAVAPGERRLGLAVRCPACGALSVNLVSQAHVDLPFANDEEIGVVDHVFARDALRSLEEFLPSSTPPASTSAGCT